MKKKIALVVQRYGLEVNGGSEYSCRLFAEQLKKKYDVDILTTKAIDYVTWDNHYSSDVEEINGVTVRRFGTDESRNIKSFNKQSEFVYYNGDKTVYDELEWMRLQGPVSFSLLRYINLNREEYEAFIFFTYTYFTTYFGLQLVPEKSILIPTAHDEPPIYLSIYTSLFHLPRYLFYLTVEEMEFVQNKFENQYIPSGVLGIGIDSHNFNSLLPLDKLFDTYNISSAYIVYVGRIDESKGCKEMFEYFIKYKKEKKSELKLVLVGKAVMDIPNHEDIINLGFVSDSEKFSIMKNAEVLVMPSKYESLSMVVLEAFYLNRPILVNAHSEVLKGHCIRSNGGLYYEAYDEFVQCLNLLLNRDFQSKLGHNGHEYVEREYIWETVMKKLNTAIENIGAS
ncbi:glycosyltransferase family 4 protein [Paenibacillus solani]|uniref:glycosyltransferase family 4 protein n=1 Tax=Paenibacillus solani TaxID=1705565 RepID=UPI003D28AD86